MYKITKSDIEKVRSMDVRKLIETFENDSVEKIIYKLKGTDLPINLIADQIKCRKKGMKKFSTFSKNNLLYESTAFEQSSSEATAIYKSTIMKGNKFIDLTGGLGIDTITLSNNFKLSIYSEMNPNLVTLFNYNSALFKNNNIQVNLGDSIDFLKNWKGDKFDWIYLDPARREAGRRSVDLEFCTPNVYENLELLKEKSKNICVKVSPAFDFTEAERKLPGLTDYIVISVNNECKEVLLLLRNEAEEIKKHAIMLDEFGEIISQYSFSSHSVIQRNVTEKQNKYFYEPDSAIIKAGLTNFIAEKYHLSGLNTSADFLLSDTLIPEFPGRVFEIKEVHDYKPTLLKKQFSEKGIKKANVTKRDFPKSVEKIRKELKLAEGGDLYLFFTKDNSNRLICLLTQKTLPRFI